MTEHTTTSPSPAPAGRSTLGAIISSNVRVLRRRRGWTQARAGQEWGRITGRPISSATWSQMEQGRRAWAAHDLAAVAAMFGVEPHVLLDPLTVCDRCDDRPPRGFACTSCGLAAPDACS